MLRIGEVPFRTEEYRRQQEALGEGFYDPLAALAQPDHKVNLWHCLQNGCRFGLLIACEPRNLRCVS